MRSLILGATGYVGRQLVPALLEHGHEVRVLARTPAKLGDAPWLAEVQPLRGDVFEPAELRAAMVGVDVVFHLVHSLEHADFAERDRRAARTVAAAALAAGVGRIVYLGGVRPDGPGEPSAHLRSRAEVGDIFLDCAVPATVLQSSIIIGAGSASYEMLRAIARHVPAVPVTGIGSRRTQPIAIADVVHYLATAALERGGRDRLLDIGGPDRLSYRELIERCAALVGGCAKVPFPFSLVATWVQALFVAGLAGVGTTLAHALLRSLRHDTVCAPAAAGEALPEPPSGRTSFERAVLLAEAQRARPRVRHGGRVIGAAAARV
ncbi:NAD(P)H-binding protein [Amycolatopsis aidingensis]|uniref:NAD(P)H-binding protein n=1 Tax=Amycolatopsis aidingensis TaxID=2842453 RepID=UPI001C0C7506|nr:NAD(P)H-binding protein [Amycolatopsis aidingensis]